MTQIWSNMFDLTPLRYGHDHCWTCVSTSVVSMTWQYWVSLSHNTMITLYWITISSDSPQQYESMRAVIVLKWMSQAQSTVISVWWLEGKLLVVACYGFSDKGTLLILARSSGLWSPLVTITPSSPCLGHTAQLSQEYEAQKLGGHNCGLYTKLFCRWFTF